eukprot:GEMP01080409.1.p1 GENE.GEMP01080409.1~~GEMP01080409.1.p1  ORF type:complete len:290 (+),score=59.00 GEMP01080409.1:36-872(+)
MDLTPQDYIASYHLDVYVRDLVQVVNGAENPVAFAANYFEKAFRGVRSADLYVTIPEMELFYKDLCADFAVSVIEDAATFLEPAPDTIKPPRSDGSPIKKSSAAEEARQHLCLDGEDAKPRPKYSFSALLDVIEFMFLYREARLLLNELFENKETLPADEIIQALQDRGKKEIGVSMPSADCLQGSADLTLPEVVNSLSRCLPDLQANPWGFPPGLLLETGYSANVKEFEAGIQKQIQKREDLLDGMTKKMQEKQSMPIPGSASNAPSPEKRKKKKKA